VNRQARIYVAGHRGLVGSSIVRRLRQEGYTDILTRTSSELDLRNQAATEAFFERFRPGYVFLAAARVGGIIANSTCPAQFIYDNLAIASNVIQAACRTEVRKLLNLGSSCIYPRTAPQPLREASLLSGPLEPTNEPYAIAKIAAIKLCRYYNEQYGSDFISVMPANLYGIHDNFDLERSHVLPAMVRKFHLSKLVQSGDEDQIRRDEAAFGPIPPGFLDALKQKAEVVLWGSGTPCREFLYADDLAKACVFLMQRYSAAEIGECINVGSGSDITIRQLADSIRNAVGADAPVRWDDSRPDGTPRKLLDSSRITALGWRPETGLETGITACYDWYRKTSGC